MLNLMLRTVAVEEPPQPDTNPFAPYCVENGIVIVVFSVPVVYEKLELFLSHKGGSMQLI